MAEKNDSLTATGESAECFSADSHGCERVQPGKKHSCSTAAGWTSLLLQSYESPHSAEPFETSPSPDQLIVLVTRGEFEIESFSNGSWKKASYRPGFGGMTAAGKTSRLRWQSKNSASHQTLHLYIPQFFFNAAADEYRRAGVPFRLNQPDALFFRDPLVFHAMLSLKEAVKFGAANLYAESVARFLAKHLLSLHGGWSEPASGIRNPGAISDRRLERVLEFMEHHYAENLSLAELSKEAGISRFHFVNLFKKACGATPHQYLVRLRMNAAALLLEDANLSVKEIAAKSGYAEPAHFTRTFQKYFSQTPSAYRSKNYAIDLG